MRAVVQRVTDAVLSVDGVVVSRIAGGLVVLLGVHQDDTDVEVRWVADKIANLRIFPDDDGKMNRSVLDTCGEVLVVSQFTLYGDARKGRRPSFVEAARPEKAEPLYTAVCDRLRGLGVSVGEGVFGAHMVVDLRNDGPVTILLDSHA